MRWAAAIEYYDMPSDPEDRAGCQARQLQVLVDRDGNRERAGVPVEHYEVEKPKPARQQVAAK